MIKLNVTHSASSMRFQELRFDMQSTIKSIKQSLEMRLGASPEDMTLQLKDTNENFVSDMGDDDALLGHYGPQEYYTIHVIDSGTGMNFNDFEDTSKVEKYKISEDAYDQRDDTFRKFKQKMKEQQNPNFIGKNKETIADDFMEEEAKLIEVGARCEIAVGERRGEVKFVNKIPELANGYWVGVLLDEPTGDSNGTIEGVPYFEAPENRALFVRPNELKVGDYPEIDVFDADEDEI